MNYSPQEIEEKLHQLINFPNSELQSQPVQGYDFNLGVNYDAIFKSYFNTGLQATHLA